MSTHSCDVFTSVNFLISDSLHHGQTRCEANSQNCHSSNAVVSITYTTLMHSLCCSSVA